MKNYILVFLLLFGSLYAETALLYKVSKGQKKLGYYEINYNQNRINSSSYGMANKIDFFIDKKIKYISVGERDFIFEKNKVVKKFNAITKLSSVSKETASKYKRKLRKVKGDDMLLLRVPNKNSIELFNKRKVDLLTLDEVLKFSFLSKIERKNIILFDKSGVMKMIAEVVPTGNGFDIINKSKDKKYIKVVIKNKLPIEVSSYVSDWSLSLYGAGKFNIHEVDRKIIKEKLKENIKSILSSKSNIKLIDLKDDHKIKKSNFLAYPKVKIEYSSGLNNSDKKRECKKVYKKFSKKASEINYNDDNCEATIMMKVSRKDIIEPIIESLVKEHKQLKFTNKIKVNKKGTIMYKLIDIYNIGGKN